MSQRTESKGPRLTTTYFHSSRVTDTVSAAEWLVSAVSLPEMEGRYIALRDLSRSADEGGGGIQLPPSVTPAEILAALKRAGADRLFLAGRYRGTQVGLGVDLNSFELAITVPSGRKDLSEALQTWTTSPC